MPSRISLRRPTDPGPTAFRRSVAVIMTGTILGQGISLVTLPVISRLYAPEAFGQYALLSSLSALLIIVTTLGLSSAVMAPDDDREAERIVSVALVCSVGLATVITIVGLALAPVLPLQAVGMPVWQVCLWVYAMTVVGVVLALLRVHTNRRGLNRTLALNSILSSLSTLVIAVPFGLLAHGSLGLILSGLAAGVICSLQMFLQVNPFRHRVSWSSVRATLRTYRGFVVYQYPANLMEAAGAQLPTQVLGGLYGSSMLGSYSMNERLLGVPLRLIGAPLSTVYFRSTSESFRAGRKLAPLTFTIVSRVTLAASVPMIVLIFFGADLFGWALGPQWSEAGILSGFLVPLYVLTLCRTSVSNCRVVIGQQRTNAGLSAVRLAIALLSLVAGHAWFGTLTGAVFCLTVGSSLFMALDMATTFSLLGSHRRRYFLLILVFGIGVLGSWYLSGALSRLT